jgi:tetratricopeptide (TPR) repeat protein
MKRLFNVTVVIFLLSLVVLAYQTTGVVRGIELYNAKKFAEAEQALAQAVQNDGENAQAHEYLGLARLSLRKLNEADAALSRAQELAPSSDSVKVGLARVQIEKQQLDGAEQLLKKAQEINSGNPDIPLYFGAIKLGRRDYQAAIVDLEEAIKRKPDNAYAYYYAGLAYNGLNRTDRMLDRLQTFLKLAPTAPEAAKVRSVLSSVR